MSSIRQKWSPITQNTYDDKKYRQHIAIITYLLPLGCVHTALYKFKIWSFKVRVLELLGIAKIVMDSQH